MQRILLKTLALSITLTAFARSQQPSSAWVGEWGSFTDDAHKQRLTISSCDGDSCTFNLSVRNEGSCNSPEKAQLTITSPADATATLPGSDMHRDQSCKLQMHRDAAGIAITATGDPCSFYYCTTRDVSFSRTYPRRSTSAYAGLHEDECFSDASPARTATCTDTALAKLEQQWINFYDAFPLDSGATKDESTYSHAQHADSAILGECDAATAAARCLNDRYTADLAAMTAKQNAYIDGYTERGDPAEAARVAAKIAGRYRHSFANGDVQGDHFKSTDTLTITPVSQNSIHFDLHLEFYNGHECSLEGGALYRKDGSFVFDADPSTAVKPWPACHLAITPTATGITFQDLLGPDLMNGCKMMSCGMRGGYNGAGFKFTDRVTPAPAKKPAAK